jgi:beta-galactosidase
VLSTANVVFADRAAYLTVDGPWQFCLVDETAPTAACPTFKGPLNSSALPSDYSKYKTITIPHDFVVEGKHTPNGSVSHGFLPMAKAWYRTVVQLPELDKQTHWDSDLWLRFEGVMSVSHVYVQGEYMTTSSSGYTPFTVDLTRFLTLKQQPLSIEIVVAVDSTSLTSWWYDGGGIYRHVNLFLARKAIRIAEYGVYLPADVETGSNQIYRDETTGQYMTNAAFMNGVTVDLQVERGAVDPRSKMKLCYEADGTTGGTQTTGQCMDIPGYAVNGDPVQTFTFPRGAAFKAALWDVDSPFTYTATVSLYRHDEHTDEKVLLDSVKETFGIRKFAWTNDGGFSLNGRPLKVKGFCNHQDFAGVGVAVPDDLQAYRVHTLRAMGANAWRTSHNPVTLALLDETDKQGLLVWDENHENLDDDLNMERQAKLVRRDRNRASVFMWSVCNEVLCKNFDAASSKKHVALIHAVDPRGQRVVSSAYNGAYMGNSSKDVIEAGDRIHNHDFLASMDVIGINYHTSTYQQRKANEPFKSRPMIISEASSDYSTRGIYVTNKTKKFVDSYDDQFPGWGSTSEVSWCSVVENDFIAGQFVWTAFDYKGEPTPYNSWPSINSHFGVLDLAGFPKDNFFYYQSQFFNATQKRFVAKIVPGVWNAEAFEGREEMNVWVYTNAPKVQLFGVAAGKRVDLGVRSFAPPTKRCEHLEYKAVSVKEYESLVLEAFDEDATKPVATDTVKRSEAKLAGMEITQDWPLSTARANQTVLIQIRLVDSKKVPVLFGENVPLTVEVTNARILGLGNGDPTDWAASDKPVHDTLGARSTFNGLMRVVLAAGSDVTKPIGIKVRAAQDETIAPATIVVKLDAGEPAAHKSLLPVLSTSRLPDDEVIVV